MEVLAMNELGCGGQRRHGVAAWLSVALSVGAVAFGAGCASEGTGNEPDPQGQIGGEPASCEVVETTLAIDEVSPLGFAASDIVAFSVGPHTATLAYDDGEVTDVTIAVGAPTAIRFVDAELGDTTSGAEIGCPDAIVLDVQVELTTADGAFAESLNVELRAETADAATWLVDVAPDALGGTFDIGTLGMDGYEDIAITFSGQLTPTEIGGDITAWGTQTSGTGPDASVSRESFAIGAFDGAAD